MEAPKIADLLERSIQAAMKLLESPTLAPPSIREALEACVAEAKPFLDLRQKDRRRVELASRRAKLEEELRRLQFEADLLDGTAPEPEEDEAPVMLPEEIAGPPEEPGETITVAELLATEPAQSELPPLKPITWTPGQFKLTDEQVAEVRQLHREGYTRKDIAAAYGIDVSYVGLISRGVARPEVPKAEGVEVEAVDDQEEPQDLVSHLERQENAAPVNVVVAPAAPTVKSWKKAFINKNQHRRSRCTVCSQLLMSARHDQGNAWFETSEPSKLYCMACAQAYMRPARSGAPAASRGRGK